MIGDLLHVDDLTVEFATEAGVIKPVDGVNLRLAPGEILGLVGESGCGKSLTALSILRLISRPGRIASGRVLFNGVDILELSEKEFRRLRGNEISMIFQQPKACLNPVIRIGRQVAEIFQIHRGLTRREAIREARALLIAVGIPDPEERLNAYPHELSGGQAQRVMIAMALALEPRLLIADEPTAALDVTMQAQVLRLLRDMCKCSGTALILMTHDMGVIAQTADRVAVMYACQIVEERSVTGLFEAPAHPYTRALLASMPDPSRPRDRLAAIHGAVPAPGQMPTGCRFAPRCPVQIDTCKTPPPLEALRDGGTVRCWTPFL